MSCWPGKNEKVETNRVFARPSYIKNNHPLVQRDFCFSIGVDLLAGNLFNSIDVSTKAGKLDSVRIFDNFIDGDGKRSISVEVYFSVNIDNKQTEFDCERYILRLQQLEPVPSKGLTNSDIKLLTDYFIKHMQMSGANLRD